MSDLSRDRRIDEICTRFEQAWRAGQRPRIEEHLTEGVEREPLLAELIAVELFHRHRLGETPTLAEYQERFPDVRPDWFDSASEPGTETAVLPETTATPGPGTRVAYFGDYQLLAEIPGGGMGVVWRSHQVSLDREVALKMIRAGEFATPEAVQRFRTEARAAASLDHPHIVPILEVGEHDGQQYYSMKLIEGGSLKDRLGEIALMPELSRSEVRTREQTIARLMVTVARAVHHAHQRGILHRDLKPANVLLDEAGQPHVTDFGLAKRIEGDVGQTQPGQILGTPSYMAPEQASGDKTITTQADVYGLGAILYELLTGRPPFRGATVMETIQQVIHDELIRPRAIVRHADRDLETICLKCLEKDPSRRYSSAEAVAEELERWLRGEPIQVRPASSAKRLTKWARRQPAQAALAGVIVLAMVSVLLVGLYFNAHLAEERNTAVREKAEAVRLTGELQASDGRLREELTTSRHALFSSQVLRAAQLWERDPDEGLRLLEDPKGCPPEMRDFAWGYYHRLCRREVKIVPNSHNDHCVSFSPDGKTLAVGGVIHSTENGKEKVISGTLRLIDASTGHEIANLNGHSTYVNGVALAGDGKTLASVDDDAMVMLWKVATREKLWAFAFTDVGLWPCSLTLSQDGRLLLVGSYSDREFHLFDTILRQEITIPQEKGRHVHNCALAPDGKTLAIASTGGGIGTQWQVAIFDLSTSEELQRIEVDTSELMSLAFSPDGRSLAAGTFHHGVIHMWNVQTGEERFRVRGGLKGFGDLNQIVFTSNGATLASSSEWGSEVTLWDTLTGRQQLVFRPTRFGTDETLAMDPHGHRLAFFHGLGRNRELRIVDLIRNGSVLVPAFPPLPHENYHWSFPNREELTRITGVNKDVRSFAFTADGQTLASSDVRGAIRLWNVESGQERAKLIGHKGMVTALVFTRDGRRLVSADTSGEVRAWEADLPSDVPVPVKTGGGR